MKTESTSPNPATTPEGDQAGEPGTSSGGGRPRPSLDVYTVEGIGVAVAQLRQATGLTQAQFGEMVGASRPWVSDLERGNLRGGQLDTVMACIRALGYRIVLEDIAEKPSKLDDLKNAMRIGPLARRAAATPDSPQ